MNFPTKKYKVIYADPPWTYTDKCHAGNRGAEYKYPCMSLSEIQKLPVESIAADNSILFMWVTMLIKFVKRLWCAVFDHRYTRTRELHASVYQVTCTRCGTRLACNDRILPGYGLPWDNEFEELFNENASITWYDA